MTQQLEDKIKSLVEAIYDTSYFTRILERMCDPRTLHTNPKAISILNEFWFALPDNSSIRTPVFFQLCDVIEGEEEEDDDEDAPAF
jgi:hypothetical protein